MFGFFKNKYSAIKYKLLFKKAKKEELTTIGKLKKDLKNLYEFVDWLNKKVLKNRRERKAFWSRVSRGESILEETAVKILTKYEKREKEITGKK